MGATPLSTVDVPTADDLIQRLVDSVSMLVWMTDSDDVCTYLNQSTLVQPANWNLLKISDWAKSIHHEDLARVGPIVRHAKENKSEYQVEYRIVRRNGSIRWMMGSGAPRFSPEGAFLGYNGTIVDVTDRYEAFERLRESEAGYRLLTENTSDLISKYAADATFVYASPSYLKVLGYEASELVGTSVYEIIHPDDVPVIQQQALQQAGGKYDSAPVEIRKRHKNGRYVWMGTKLHVLNDPVTNRISGTIAFSRDISAEHQAKAALAKREERFRSLTRLSSDWYWETDEHERFTFISKEVEQLFGYKPIDYIGKTRRDFATDPNDEALQEYFAKIAKREPFKNVQYKANSPNSNIRYACLSGEPVFENGIFKGYRGIGRDVTGEVKLAKQLAELAGANEALIENSLDIMVMLDQEGRYVRVNDAVRTVLGYDPDELLGRHYTEFLHSDDIDISLSLESKLRTGQHIIQDFETRWIRKDGRVVFLSNSVLWSADRKVMYATSRDVSDRHRISTELQKSKDELVKVMESIGDAFYSLDRDWRATYVNQKTAQFIGIPKADLLGRTLWEIVPSFKETALYPYFKKAMETCQNIFFEDYFEPTKSWVEVRLYPHAGGLSIFFHDITERRKADEAIRTGERRLRNIIGMTPAGYLLTDAHGIIVEGNLAICDITGYSQEELVGCDVMELLPRCPLDGALFVRHGTTSVHGKEAIIQHKDGELRYVLLNVSIERDAEGNAMSLTAFITDISERKKSEAKLEELATHDALTGLPNRSHINARLQQMLSNAHKNDSLAVMFIDLDRFKEVNDSLGHAPGDILLQAVAHRLQTAMRVGDVVARLGGDEFVAATHCSDGKQSASTIAEKLLSVLAAPFDIDGQEVFVSASIGISMYPEHGGTKELLFQNADTAMYRAKAAGRNGYRFFEAEMSIEARSRMTIESGLRRALERHEFELHYQPKIDLKTMTVTGSEALIRWHHPQLGSIPPLQFIPIAEERGLIEPIGEWVLNEACRETRRLIDKFGRMLHVSVNLSARQLKCPDLIQQVEQALKQAELPPYLLELELTETALIEDIELSVEVLKELRERGIRLSVDDFGTGYSGLAYLRRFPLDVLKLDRSFLASEPNGARNFEFVKAFVDMAHALKLSVVAEGVEDEDVVQFLKDSACDEAQGYFFSKPLSVADFDAYLTKVEARAVLP